MLSISLSKNPDGRCQVFTRAPTAAAVWEAFAVHELLKFLCSDKGLQVSLALDIQKVLYIKVTESHSL